MYKYIQSNLKKLSLLKIRKFYRFMFFWINLMVYTESVWKFYSKFMSENMNRNVFENWCRKWLNNIFWQWFHEMNCAFSYYFCTEHFVFLTMLSKITSKYILGIPYGSKVDKNGSVMLQKAIFYNVSTKKNACYLLNQVL